ncbi:MAG TPA: hypothetical protein VIG38_09085 [Hyphomicrobium sp.]
MTDMRGLGGFVLLAGIGVGLFVYFPAPVDRDTSLEQAQRVMATRVASSTTVAPSTTQVAPTTKSTPSRVASFAPTRPLPAPQRKSRVAATPAVPAAPVIAAAVPVETIPAWTTNVSPAATVGGPQGSLDPTDPESRYKLVVDIQQQLKRVGCYWGRVNGSWNNNTREAMRSFTMHTNAALPVEKPDYLLLSLLQSHGGRSCGAPETTVVAQPRGKKEQVAATAPAPEVLPWKAGSAAQPATRLYTPLPNSVVSTEPLPGRMAIGGPRDLPPAVQAPLIPGTPPGTAPGQPGVATAALDPGGAPPASVSTPSAGPKPRQAKKSESWRRPGPGTPRYNLMLSLGGVY